MNTWIKAACKKLISNDTYSITHNLRDPVDPVESNSKCEQRHQIDNYTDNLQPGVSQFPCT